MVDHLERTHGTGAGAAGGPETPIARGPRLHLSARPVPRASSSMDPSLSLGSTSLARLSTALPKHSLPEKRRYSDSHHPLATKVDQQDAGILAICAGRLVLPSASLESGHLFLDCC